MRRQGQHINIHLFHIYLHMPCRLHRVGMENNAGLPADRSDLFYRLKGSDLIVGKHYADQRRVLPQCRLYILRPDETVLIHRQKRHAKALALQLFQRMEHRMMLKCRRDQMRLSFSFPPQRSGADRLIVRLTAA